MSEHYNFDYQLQFENGSVIPYRVEVDKITLISTVSTLVPFPEWTKLEYKKCDHCTLPDTEYCPIAVRLVEPIKRFGKLISHTPLTVTVTTPERNYVKRVDVQDALRSLFGLIMATSGCPSMRPFKYMARYHLPFASLEETITRITSTYLMLQLFKNIDQEEVHMDFNEIYALYTTLQSLNEGMSRRIKSAAEADGTLNAIVILSAYSSLIPMVIKDELKKLKPLFE